MVQGTLQNLLLLFLAAVIIFVCRLAVYVFMLIVLNLSIAITSDLHPLQQSILYLT